MTANMRYNLDLTRSGVQVSIDAYQGDTSSRKVLFTLSNGAIPYEPTKDTVAVVYALKPDGKKIENRCAVTSDGIEVDLTSQFTKIAGTVSCQLVLYCDNVIIASPEFTVKVRERWSFPVYEPLISEPDDWETNYSTYYSKNDGGFYESVAGDSAPIWEDGKYYRLSNPTAESENEYGALLSVLAKAEEMFERSLKYAMMIETGATKEDISNKITAISEKSTDKEYPSAKAVYDLLPKRQTIVVDTPIWDNQPIMQPVTLPFMVISIKGYTTGGGPARIYIENRVDLTQVQVGDILCWWGDLSNDPTVDDLRNNVYDTVKTVAVDGSNITITTNGGNGFTSSYISYADIKFAGNATLLPNFELWTDACYFVTLKDTDGTALSDGQFKLCTAYDGYADAIDQIFTISGKTLSENMAVDFKTISEDRTSFEMRDAGVKNINIHTKNNKSQRYVFSVLHNYMTANAPGAKYLYIQDDIGKALRSSALYYSSVGKYTGTSGFLLPIADSRVGSCGQLSYTITMNRTHVGLNVSLHCLRVYDNQRVTFDNNGYSDCSAGTEDFSSMELNEFILVSNNAYYFRNGTSITLEEFI